MLKKNNLRVSHCYFGLWLVFIMLIGLPLSGAKEFKKVESWNFGDQPFSYVWYSTVSADGSVFAYFNNSQCVKKFTPKKMELLGCMGEGPGDLMYSFTCFPYQNDIGFYEIMNERLKIFTNTPKGMKWKETIWFKRDKCLHYVRDVLFTDNKFFCAGVGEYPDNDLYFLVQVFDMKGQSIKKLIQYRQPTVTKSGYMRHHILKYHDNVFVISEDKLLVHVISAKDLSEKASIKLTAPAYYKKMPDSFFILKKYPNGSIGFHSDVEEWSGGYSRIIKATIDGNYLVLAIRTCDPKLKKFCLLHYRLDTFQLVNQVFIDDFLLGARDGRYYCFANGESGVDENTDECTINVYQWVEKK